MMTMKEGMHYNILELTSTLPRTLMANSSQAELPTFTCFQFCNDSTCLSAYAPFQVNLLNNNTYRWNCAMSSYGQIE